VTFEPDSPLVNSPAPEVVIEHGAAGYERRVAFFAVGWPPTVFLQRTSADVGEL
jgi:hypothetical protein